MPSRTQRPWAGSLAGAVRQAGGRIDADAAAIELFRPLGGSNEAARRVVEALATMEPSLTLTTDGAVALAGAESLHTPTHQATFVVVDLETTGSTSGPDRIIEIGAVRVAAARLVDTYSVLVQPGQPVPAFISRLTGIDGILLEHAPPFATVHRAFLDFVGNAAVVAHNAGFDLRFLDHELRATGAAALANPVLCTVKLSRKLLPQLRACTLDSLADHFGYSFDHRHRALSDADVTARVLIRLFDLAAERGVRSLGQLLKLGGWCRRSRRQARQSLRLP